MLEILYSDAEIAAIVKPAGMLSEEGSGIGVPSELRTALQTDVIYPVHRLDRETGGVMVYARTKFAAGDFAGTVGKNLFCFGAWASGTGNGYF